MSDDIDKNDTGDAPDDGGRGESIDPTARGDRVLLRRAACNRWPIPDALKQKIVASLDKVLGSNDPREVNGAARVLVAMEGQNQTDQLAYDKNERLDDGKPTEAASVVYRVEFDE